MKKAFTHPLSQPLALLFGLLASLFFAVPAHAQFNVNIELKRNLFIRYEPILATVSVTNLSGRDIVLEDGASSWFGFTVFQGDAQTVISPRNPDYHQEPMEIKLGETVKRTVNLFDLFPISELGYYRVRANIYNAAQDKYYASRMVTLDIQDGRTIWRQSVGVPDTLRNAGAVHEFRLVAAVGSSHNYLYARITEPDTGKVFGCYRIGHLLDGVQPDLQFDTTNTLHILMLVAPKTYSLTQIGVNGEVYGQWTYDAPKYKPALRRDGSGNLEIVGATRRAAPVAGSTPAPKLSDRPVGLPR